MRVAGIPYVQGRNSYPDADGKKYGIAIHNTSNDGTAEDEANYAKRRGDGISAHFYADAAKVIQSLDTAARAGHAGSSNGNQNAVAVEITGFNGWTRQQWLDRVAWDKLAAALAQVCAFYGIEPRQASVAEMRTNPKVRAFYTHDQMRMAWGGTDHTDPGKNFPMDHLLAAVRSALGGAVSGDSDDMSYNDREKADTAFNNDEYADLDTDGTIDGKGNIQKFPNKTYAAIKANVEAIAKLAEVVNGLTAGGGGTGLTAGQVREIVREEISRADIQPGPPSA